MFDEDEGGPRCTPSAKAMRGALASARLKSTRVGSPNGSGPRLPSSVLMITKSPRFPAHHAQEELRRELFRVLGVEAGAGVRGTWRGPVGRCRAGSGARLRRAFAGTASNRCWKNSRRLAGCAASPRRGAGSGRREGIRAASRRRSAAFPGAARRRGRTRPAGGGSFFPEIEVAHEVRGTCAGTAGRACGVVAMQSPFEAGPLPDR